MTSPASLNWRSARTRRPPRRLNDFVRRIYVNHDSSCDTLEKMTKVKKTAELARPKRQTVFSCVLCDRSLKGPPFLSRQLLHVHRTNVLLEPFAGPHYFNVDQLQFLVRGVSEDDAIYLAEDRRYGGRTGDAEAGSLAPMSPAGRHESATLAEQSPMATRESANNQS